MQMRVTRHEISSLHRKWRRRVAWGCVTSAFLQKAGISQRKLNVRDCVFVWAMWLI
jgi:hypothetical protein